MKEEITRIFIEVFKQQYPGAQIPEITDGMVLLESGLDSLGFAVLVVELEQQLGIDPFTTSEDAFYPSTFREFIEFYEKHKP